MYRLYFDRINKVIRLSPVKNNSFMIYQISDEVTSYNDCYFICNNRKKLREKANSLKMQWVMELEEELEDLNNMKITNRY